MQMIHLLQVAGAGLIVCVIGMLFIALTAEKDPDEEEDNTADFYMDDYEYTWKKKVN